MGLAEHDQPRGRGRARIRHPPHLAGGERIRQRGRPRRDHRPEGWRPDDAECLRHPPNAAGRASLTMVTRFSHADVDAFAAASYDRNPLHVDEAYARRTVFGRRVVHGVASLLRALAELPAREGRSLASLTAHFA